MAVERRAHSVLEDEQRKAKEDELRRMEFAMEFGQEEEEAGDPHEGRRVHAWVLLLPKKRGVTAPLFIEPTTGECFAPEASPYEGVEFVWNHQNFWVCMQMPEPHSDSRRVALPNGHVRRWRRCPASILFLRNSRASRL